MAEQEGIPIPREARVLKEKEKSKPYERVAEIVGISADRLRRLLNTGRVEGQKVRKKGKGYPWRWMTSRREVERYQASVKTPREYGLLGGRPKKKGIGIRV